MNRLKEYLKKVFNCPDEVDFAAIALGLLFVIIIAVILENLLRRLI